MNTSDLQAFHLAQVDEFQKITALSGIISFTFFVFVILFLLIAYYRWIKT